MYTQQGRAQEALQLLQAAVMAAPDYAEAHNNLGVLQVGLGAVLQQCTSSAARGSRFCRGSGFRSACCNSMRLSLGAQPLALP